MIQSMYPLPGSYMLSSLVTEHLITSLSKGLHVLGSGVTAISGAILRKS